MRTAVVILNWNGRKMLERFLPSVVANTQGDDAVIIADNGSTDDSVAFLQQAYPQLRIIQMDKNYGFAEGYNKALALVDAEYFVLLNDDVEVTPGWIDPVLDLMQSDPLIAIAQPKLMMYDHRDLFEYAGGAGGFIDQYGYPFCRGRMFNTLETDHGQYNDACDIFWASGAAMFVKSKVWKELGGLDGDFFAHMEEIDFCWRAKNQGYRAMYCPQSTVYHVGGGTLPKSSPMKTYLNFRNNLALLSKNLPDNRKNKVLLQRKVLDFVAALKFIASGNFKEGFTVAKAHKDFRKWKNDIQRKRAALNPHEVSCVYRRLILTDYYLKGTKHFSDLDVNKFVK